MRGLTLGRMGELAVFVAVVALGKPVLVPLALAFYLAFVLTPPSNALERFGVPRFLSVAAVIGVTVATVGVLGSVLAGQAADLHRQMRTYAGQMAHKLSGLRAGKLGALGDLTGAFSELGHALDPALGVTSAAAPVRLVVGNQSTFQRLEEVLGPLLQPLGLITLVFVLAIFMLGHREDLRGRLLQLVGPQNLTVTTRTMGEAVNRVGRVLLTQAYINAGFGAVLTLGLYMIGIPYALLWGVLAGLLRFVPLLGALIAAVLPMLVAFAVFPGWDATLLTLGLFLVVETSVANFIEPMVLGKRTGVSALALLVSALFWTWLWGPAGLLLATPITVCAAVVGRHVPNLAFLSIALGDDAGLHADVNFYQRTLAKVTKDAYRLAKRLAGETSLAQTLDEVVVPALGLMVHDLNVDAISQADADRVVADVSDIVSRLAPAPTGGDSLRARPHVFGIAAESNADLLLLQLLHVTLAEQSAQLLPYTEIDRAKALAAAIQAQPTLVCIAALPPSGSVNARFLCRRLRAELPAAFIVVLLPEAEIHRSKEAAARLREAGANVTAASLREASRLLVRGA